MNDEARQASTVIDSVARAVANWTVDRHAELNPQLPNRYGSSWRGDWIGHTTAQIHMLGQAVAVRSTDLFVQSVSWTSESFRSRGVEQADLINNTQCMKDVLVDELPPPVSDQAMAYLDASLKELNAPQNDLTAESTRETDHHQHALMYQEAILSSDRAAAESIVLDRFEQGATAAEIYEQILTPAQARMGSMWHRGEISIADEHFGSALTRSLMAQLRPRFPRAANNGRRVVATATPGDLHEIGLQMVADLFELDGWNSIYLGANTPAEDVIELLKRIRADLLALSVGTPLRLRDAGQLIDMLRETKSIAATKVIVGGPPFNAISNLWIEVGADGCASSASEAVSLGNTLLAP